MDLDFDTVWKISWKTPEGAFLDVLVGPEPKTLPGFGHCETVQLCQCKPFRLLHEQLLRNAVEGHFNSL